MKAMVSRHATISTFGRITSPALTDALPEARASILYAIVCFIDGSFGRRLTGCGRAFTGFVRSSVSYGPSRANGVVRRLDEDGTDPFLNGRVDHEDDQARKDQNDCDDPHRRGISPG